ncbi:transglutaminase domain-containing protein [Bacteroides sp. 51]|uniref:TPR end-of-group domain-containing protein n=1 Tax=Bacteroides sp. 51 TaxID=2302938 RepID=UPI0013D847BC|nr:transglutaminase domain-containing protein [Bacteroides sp. 51]NDV83094.1 transglutaminase domain-containing protein [Bacteroides sp. 51]
MKKILIMLTALVISLTVAAQTDSQAFNEFIPKYEALYEAYQNHYKEKDFEQTKESLQEALALIDNLNLSETELEDYRPILRMLKASTYYNQACTYSLLNQKKQALSAFEKAIEFGYSEYQHAKKDRDLDNIRKEKKFTLLMDKLRVYDKLYILQHAGDYQQENTDSLPKFTYQPATNRNLKEVKQYFNLDSIAGNGDEVTKIINILLFVTHSVKYDGSNWALCEFDAIDFYNYHKATSKGINCRHKAMMLNELYLAMGLKSRYVTCMPEDPEDPDCHVINCVYSETLEKWLWMDPSHGIYITDENGNLLSISEVRNRLRNNQPLAVNKETSKTKEWYLDYYMAKNLYWIQCTNVSRFNTESRYRSQDKDLLYISLLPMGYGEENPYLKGNIVTHDPDYFWQVPEK